MLLQRLRSSSEVLSKAPIDVVPNEHASARSERSARRAIGAKRAPKKSLIVLLLENRLLSSEFLSDHLPDDTASSDMDVILACAGQPPSIGPIQRRVRDLQLVLTPAGTSGEDLRELAMRRASGDIVTLVTTGAS